MTLRDEIQSETAPPAGNFIICVNVIVWCLATQFVSAKYLGYPIA